MMVRYARNLLILALISCLSLEGMSSAEVTVDGGPETGKLLDGNTEDNGAWRGTGPQVLRFSFRQPVKLATIRVYPGVRAYSGMPSTEGGPKTMRIQGWRHGAVAGNVVTAELPRDHRESREFFCDVNVNGMPLCDAVTVELVSTHDGGCRVHSPNKPVVAEQERSYNIREIAFMTVADIARKEAVISQLLTNYAVATAPDNAMARALKRCFDSRFHALRIAYETTPRDWDWLQKEAAWLTANAQPWFTVKLASASSQDIVAVEVTVKEGKAGEVAAMPINFSLLEQLVNRRLSRFSVQVLAMDEAGTTMLPSCLEPLAPDRSRLSWALTESTRSYLVCLGIAGETEQPLLDKLVGNGDVLKLGRFVTQDLPWNFWSVQTQNLFGDDAPALIAGRWTDYAHVYRNYGKNNNFRFLEAAHYVVRDPWDEPVGTDKHHGLAFSLVELCDADGDGVTDVFMSRFYNTQPLFLHGRGHALMLDFAAPVPVRTLPSGRRYAYGDVNGDGIADAVSVRLAGKTVTMGLWQGQGLDADGVPRFAAEQPLTHDIPDSAETSRGVSGCTPSIFIGDLNGDGLLDCSVMVPPNLYVGFNEGTRNSFIIKTMQQVKTDDGKPFQSTFYYPNFGWADVNGDGIPDLFRRTANNVWRSSGSVLTVKAKSERCRWLESQATLPFAGLGSFDILDFDGDGNLDFCQLAPNGNWRLNVHAWQQGIFAPARVYQLEPPGSQRFGCPDNTEYHSHYAQQRIADMDGDGLPDILLNTEHNWRFGYFSFYRNLGNGTFAPEEQLAPSPVPNFPETVASPHGQALNVTHDSLLDYLSLETAKLLSVKGGAIEFTFRPNADTIHAPGRMFFSSSFWDRKAWKNSTELYEAYRACKTLEAFLAAHAGFAFGQLPDGRLVLQVNHQLAATAAAVALPTDGWTAFAVRWRDGRTTVAMNGTEIMALSAMPSRLAERVHLGSQAWMAVQYAREYPSRRATHPVDFSCPAEGAFDDFRFYGADGKSTLSLDFTTQFGTLKNRSQLVYRTAPGVVRYGDGQALVANLGDPNRTKMKGCPWAVLTLIPFSSTPGKAPVFHEPKPLNMTDGTPFYCHSRTVVVPYDWNHDGAPDILLSTENYANPCNIGIELFINDGHWNFTRTPQAEIIRLNELLTAHHDIKLVMAKLLDGKEDDFIVWTDPGLRAYRRAFLRQQPVVLQVNAIGGTDLQIK